MQGGLNGFGKIEIIYQKKNLGAYENGEFLIKYAEKNYDRYIFSEDDNEFSPNFIEYIDKGLELFEKNDEIISICANGVETPEDNRNNVVLSENYTAYGCGMWARKRKKVCDTVNRKFLLKIAGNTRLLFELAKKNDGVLFALQNAVYRREQLYQLTEKKVPVIDQTIKMYMLVEEKYVIAPCMRKVRNWGHDGSGVNCPKDDMYITEKTEIDTSNYFDYLYGIPIKKEKMHTEYSFESICRILVAIIKLKLYKDK